MNDDEDDDYAITLTELLGFMAGCVRIVREGRDRRREQCGRSVAGWFYQTTDPANAAALLAEVRAMTPDERGAYARRAMGALDA